MDASWWTSGVSCEDSWVRSVPPDWYVGHLRSQHLEWSGPPSLKWVTFRLQESLYGKGIEITSHQVCCWWHQCALLLAEE